MLVVFWYSYNILIIICIQLCMIFNKINNNRLDLMYNILNDYDYDYDYEMLLLRHKEIQYNMS